MVVRLYPRRQIERLNVGTADDSTIIVGADGIRVNQSVLTLLTLLTTVRSSLRSRLGGNTFEVGNNSTTRTISRYQRNYLY